MNAFVTFIFTNHSCCCHTNFFALQCVNSLEWRFLYMHYRKTCLFPVALKITIWLGRNTYACFAHYFLYQKFSSLLDVLLRLELTTLHMTQKACLCVCVFFQVCSLLNQLLQQTAGFMNVVVLYQQQQQQKPQTEKEKLLSQNLLFLSISFWMVKTTKNAHTWANASSFTIGKGTC